MKKRAVTKAELQDDPHCVWNAYVNVLAMEIHEDLAPDQRPAHLVFWYEHEVQNGGHFQYFENRGTEHLAETIEALGLLGASCQQEVLRDAGALWQSRERPPIKTVEDFCEEALEGEFSVFDSRFHACKPDLPQCLEEHLRHCQDRFVTVI